MSALAASAALTPFNRFFKQPRRLAPIGWRMNAVNTWLFASSGWKGTCLASSSTDATIGGTIDELEDKTTLKPYLWSDDKKPRICILGGGFGGLYTALRLESLEWPDDKKPQVLLIDQSKHFVFKPMLYELLSGEVEPWEIAPRFSDLLSNTSVRYYQGRVKLLHPFSGILDNGFERSTCTGTVLLESGLLIEYDWLVLALGVKSNLDLVPGAVEFALPFSTLEDACKVNNKLKLLERRNFGKEAPISVVVVGCGYSGVELAATVSERLKDKGMVQAVNVESTICPSALPGNREAALKVLSDRNVRLLLGYFVQSIRKASDDGLSQQSSDHDFEDHDHGKFILELQPSEKGLQGMILEADLVLWTVGNKAQLPNLEPCDKPHQLPLNAKGQAETDENLCVKGHPRIFAVGDSAAFRDSGGKLLPATAQVAFQQADFVGWNLWAAINDRSLLPFRFQNLGEMMTLGRSNAAVSPSFVDGLTLEGPIGHAARKLAYLIRLPTDEHRLKVGLSWFTKTAVDSVAILQTSLTKVLSG